MAVTLTVIRDTRAAIVSALETALSAETTNVVVMQDSDETTQERVLEIASKSPTVLVAWTGSASGTYASRKSSVERFAAGIWAAPIPSSQKHRRTTALDVAAQIARVVARTVLGNDWDVDGVEKATDFQCDNLSGGVPDAEGYALLVITWEQRIDFPAAVDVADLEDLTSVYTTIDLESPGAHTEDEFSISIP